MIRSLQTLGVLAVIASQKNVPLVMALGTNYAHDGKTTYCWHIDEPASNAKLTELDRTQGYSGTQGCPISMTVSLAVKSVEVNTPVNVSWTVGVDFSGPNLVNMTELVYGQDMSNQTAQIVHSNVHSCVYESGCDPFNNGDQLEDKTANQVANFTDNAADFGDAVQFRTAGEYSVLAHIIMSDTNTSRQFAYAVYQKFTVTDIPTSATSTPSTSAPVVITTKDGGVSQAGVIGIIVGGVVVVVAILVCGAVMWRRQGNANANNYNYHPAPSLPSIPQQFPVGVKDNLAESDADSARPTSYSDPRNSVPVQGVDDSVIAERRPSRETYIF